MFNNLFTRSPLPGGKLIFYYYFYFLDKNFLTEKICDKWYKNVKFSYHLSHTKIQAYRHINIQKIAVLSN